MRTPYFRNKKKAFPINVHLNEKFLFANEFKKEIKNRT